MVEDAESHMYKANKQPIIDNTLLAYTCVMWGLIIAAALFMQGWDLRGVFFLLHVFIGFAAFLGAILATVRVLSLLKSWLRWVNLVLSVALAGWCLFVWHRVRHGL